MEKVEILRTVAAGEYSALVTVFNSRLGPDDPLSTVRPFYVLKAFQKRRWRNTAKQLFLMFVFMSISALAFHFGYGFMALLLIVVAVVFAMISCGEWCDTCGCKADLERMEEDHQIGAADFNVLTLLRWEVKFIDLCTKLFKVYGSDFIKSVSGDAVVFRDCVITRLVLQVVVCIGTKLTLTGEVKTEGFDPSKALRECIDRLEEMHSAAVRFGVSVERCSKLLELINSPETSKRPLDQLLVEIRARVAGS